MEIKRIDLGQHLLSKPFSAECNLAILVPKKCKVGKLTQQRRSNRNMVAIRSVAEQHSLLDDFSSYEALD